MSRMTYKQAIAKALADAMADNPKTLVYGQDVGRFSILGITAGLYERFGAERVRDCPISESAMVGMAVGAGMRGYATMIEVAYADIVAVAFSSFVHSAAKLPYASNGILPAPVILRAPIGRWSRHGPMGTEITASWFYNVPDITIAMPATPYQAYRELRAAYGRSTPTLYLEDKGLYTSEGTVGEGAATDLLREGDQLTIVAAGRTGMIACGAADLLGGGIVSVIAPACVKPLDLGPILDSVSRTGRLLVVQDEPPLGGYGPYLLSRLAQQGVSLKTPPQMLSRADMFLPYKREEDHLPTIEQVAAAARALL
jgi:pyruvate/2-oxoglutarate/acetoin dehydrogenase E1 component